MCTGATILELCWHTIVSKLPHISVHCCMPLLLYALYHLLLWAHQRFHACSMCLRICEPHVPGTEAQWPKVRLFASACSAAIFELMVQVHDPSLAQAKTMTYRHCEDSCICFSALVFTQQWLLISCRTCWQQTECANRMCVPQRCMPISTGTVCHKGALSLCVITR